MRVRPPRANRVQHCPQGVDLKTKPESVIQNTAPLAAIRLGGGEGGVQVARARLLLVVFMRGVALLWLAGGVLQWADLLTDRKSVV